MASILHPPSSIPPAPPPPEASTGGMRRGRWLFCGLGEREGGLGQAEVQPKRGCMTRCLSAEALVLERQVLERRRPRSGLAL